MDSRSVQLQVGGQSYRVTSSASESELLNLAESVNTKISEIVPPGRPVPPQALLLAAMALAHELDSERARRQELERRSRDILRRVLVRIDDALDTPD